MVERNNEVHRRILSKITQLDADMLRWTEALATNPHSPVPPCTLQESRRCYPSDSENEEDSSTFIKDPTASGRIYLQDATSVIYRISASLVSQNVGVSAGETLFKFDHERREFGTPRTYICTILLPGTPADGISGSPSISRAHARRTACYRACEALVAAGILDYHLFPLPLDSLNDAETKSSSSQNLLHKKTLGTRLYPRKEPVFWANTESAPLTLLYPTIIFTNDVEKSSQSWTPFLILTRQFLPDMASFNLFCSTVPIRIHFRRGAAFEADTDRLRDLHLYTVRLTRIISNKPYTCEIAKTVCFFAPLKSKAKSSLQLGETFPSLPSVVEFVPWDLIALAARDYAVPLKTGSLEELQQDVEDGVIQDRWVEFTRRYEVVRTRPDLTPLSRPLDSPVCHLCSVA